MKKQVDYYSTLWKMVSRYVKYTHYYYKIQEDGDRNVLLFTSFVHLSMLFRSTDTSVFCSNSHTTAGSHHVPGLQ